MAKHYPVPDGSSCEKWLMMCTVLRMSQVDFLLELQRLDDPKPLPCPAALKAEANGSSPRELPERAAARGLFRWEVRPAQLHGQCLRTPTGQGSMAGMPQRLITAKHRPHRENSSQHDRGLPCRLQK